MMALPHQTTDSYFKGLQKVISLQPEHISAYSLIIEEGTKFFGKYEEDARLREKGQKPRQLPDEDSEREMYAQTKVLLAQNGYEQYEISNYAKPGYECRHNIGYWIRQDYLGLGLGAASLIGNLRFSNTDEIKEYLSAFSPPNKSICGQGRKETEQILSSCREHAVLSVSQQMEETMFLGLRLTQGVDKHRFCEQFHQTVEEVYADVLSRLESRQLLKNTPERVMLTSQGMDVANYCMAQFLLE
jgi:oxygen-independent coproporphyrinogen-3 oxidase